MVEEHGEDWITVFHSQHLKRARLVAELLSAGGLRTLVAESTDAQPGAGQTLLDESPEIVPGIKVPRSQAARARELLSGYEATS